MSRILAVDDSPTMLRLLSSMLDEEEYEMLHAMDGEQAVSIASEQVPDLVLLDVVLPKLNGYQVCRQIKSTKGTAHIPIVLITRKSREQDRRWGLEQGADAYITKPFKADDLLSVVDLLLNDRVVKGSEG